jgi:alpha-ketoglutarate-dependent taurine dioxygenase
MQLKRIAGALGAELSGIDLRQPLHPDAAAQVRQALLDHGVIFLRRQPLTPEQFLAFARAMGEPVEYPFVKGIEGYPHITPPSAASGIRTPPTCKSRPWARCCWPGKCRPMAATRCSPASTPPGTRYRPP